MTEYIDRHEAVVVISRPALTRAELRRFICQIPAADVVEVVRCKDCGWWNEDDSAGWGHLGNNVCACAYFSNEDGYTVYTEPNDYCSKGERKEGEE